MCWPTIGHLYCIESFFKRTIKSTLKTYHVYIFSVLLFMKVRRKRNPHWKPAYQNQQPQQKHQGLIFFKEWLRNLSLSAGLDPVLSHTEKLCIASYYRQFSMNIKVKMIKSILCFFSLDLRSLGLVLIFSSYNYASRKLSIIRCNK